MEQLGSSESDQKQARKLLTNRPLSNTWTWAMVVLPDSIDQ